MAKTNDDRVEKQVESASAPKASTQFGGSNYTDGRRRGEWKSRYEPAAIKEIRFESCYLGLLLLVLIPAAFVILWLEYPRVWFNISEDKYQTILRYGLAWFGGLLGGTLFDLKWLYHL